MSCDDLDSVQTLDGMGFKRSSSSQRFLLDDIPTASTPSSTTYIHITPDEAQAAAASTIAAILDPIRDIIPSWKEKEPLFIQPAVKHVPCMDRKAKSSVNLRSIKSASSTNLLSRGISTIDENKVIKARPSKHDASKSFIPTQRIPMNFGTTHLNTSSSSRASVANAPSFTPLIKKEDTNDYPPRQMEIDLKQGYDTLSSASFLTDDIIIRDYSLEDITMDLSAQEIKNSDPLQCMVDDRVMPLMSSLDDDLLLALATDDDWAIGEGLDMDIS
jgi:hypothetical protein